MREEGLSLGPSTCSFYPVSPCDASLVPARAPSALPRAAAPGRDCPREGGSSPGQGTGAMTALSQLLSDSTSRCPAAFGPRAKTRDPRSAALAGSAAGPRKLWLRAAKVPGFARGSEIVLDLPRVS